MSPTAADVSEYDRFGPWIDEITVPEDVPRVFRSHPIDLSATRAVLKVPRGIARRDATAGMDLYDFLVILDRNSLTLLSRRVVEPTGGASAGDGRGYDVLAVPLADVVAIRDDLNLLDGRLSVSTTTGALIAVPYNGSAHAKVARLVDQLRAVAAVRPAGPVGMALVAAGNAVAGVASVPDPGCVDTHLVSRFLELHSDNPGLVVWASHGSRRMHPVVVGLQGALLRVSHAASPMTLHGAALVADVDAMELLGRNASLVRGRNPDYSSSRLVIPLGALDRLNLSAHPVYPDATIVTIGAGQWATDFAIPSDSDAARLFRAGAHSVRN
ncbi:hypothetical protein [Demequina lutea]|uniref:Uncharacterized protein n=1 Tax=Demequina lutea TaxID=431489 RepID=A0A7Y9Z976_9MICO|nr:hypothetical protein [Demequina lutea]NYI40580.1 hypothetical protein [Demequina lutea]